MNEHAESSNKFNLEIAGMSMRTLCTEDIISCFNMITTER